MKDRIYRWCSAIIAICTIVVLLVTSIDIHAFHRGFYESEYTVMDTATQLGLSHRDLMSATTTLLDYLQDKRQDVSTLIEVRGFEKEAFNERETLHMVDVKNLYQNALRVRNIALIVLVLSLCFMVYKQKEKVLEYLSKAYIQISIYFILFITFLGFWAAVDFTSLWENFHHVFFRNDLWLLNPRTDLMINMFPEEFFFHMVIRITITFIICFLIPFGLSIYYLNRKYHFLHRYKKEKHHA